MQRIAIIGMGQIARSQHFPTILADKDFSLTAAVNPVALPDALDIPLFPNFDALLASDVAVDAIAICTPPVFHYEIARCALKAGLHVLLEKPPTLTVSETLELARIAKEQQRTLFTAWHSKFAAALPMTRSILREHDFSAMSITWQENNEKWHPHANWFWDSVGFGAFDAGINALSIVVSVIDKPIFFKSAELNIQRQRQAPVSAHVAFSFPDPEMTAEGYFDCGYQGQDETWTIAWTLKNGAKLLLSEGGAFLQYDGETLFKLPEIGPSSLNQEYPAIYRRFSDLISQGISEIDTAPLQLVTDILAYGKRTYGA
ncbi:Gfo/Idh/MocA family protein [Kozakia baliensis]|uniref:Gfo/Idh/MocA family protein n=1 Tax=Kozakia baliensis TaxID=153496 RepID=UPI000497C30B|nr:Gfo/Idh/MocA family oxidoreductase [Kozakia baliensis]